jgi:hypothetical protein
MSNILSQKSGIHHALRIVVSVIVLSAAIVLTGCHHWPFAKKSAPAEDTSQAAAPAESAPMPREITLKNKSWEATFDTASGALMRLESRTTDWKMQARPDLGVSFRLNAPVDRRDNYVYGRNQKPVQVKKLSENQVLLQWQNLQSEKGGVLPITLTAVVSLTNDTLMFDTTVENDSPLMISTIDYPYLGDFSAPSKGASMWTEHMWYANLADGQIPGKPIQSRQSLFCLIQSTNVGLYVEMHDPTEPYLLEFAFNHRGSNRSTNNPSRLEFFTTHYAYVHPNTTVTLAPVVMRAYQGDWHAGVDCYKEWHNTWFKQPHLPQWIQDVNSWQQLQIDSPEQDFRVAYTNLIAYGQQCADNGVAGIQLVGWNHWGQDGGDPAQDIEPGLGTWQDLHDAIAQIQAKGVHIVLFGKLNWADLTMPWYTNELYKYQCMDENGNRYGQGGYSYYTPTQLAGLNTHHRAVMDFCDPQYREIANNEFKKVLALDASGFLWDELCHHADVLYSWAPDHGYTAPGYIYHGDIDLCSELRATADQKDPDFLLCGEGPEDWLMQYFPLSYFRIGNDSKPVCRYIDSKIPLMCAVTGWDDREMLNLILMDRYIISYEPYNFKGYLEDFPLTLAYGKKIDDLRRKYKDYLWDAEFRDTLGADVTADGKVRHTVFVTPSGKRAVVVVNQELTKAITATVTLPNPGDLIVATPEQPDAMPTDGTLQIPARSAAVVMER